MTRARPVHSAASVVIAIGCAFFAGCGEKPPRKPVEKSVDADLVFPLQRALMNESGAVIDAEILGRSENAIMFVRKDNGNEYTLPIDRLFPADQARMRRLPLRPYEFKTPPTPLTRQQEAIKRAIAFRKKEISRLRRRLDAMKLERDFGERSTYNVGIQKLEKQIGMLGREVGNLEALMREP